MISVLGILMGWILPFQPWMTDELWELYARAPQAFPLMLQIPVDHRLLRSFPDDPVVQSLARRLFPERDRITPALWGSAVRDTLSWSLFEGSLIVPAGAVHFTWNARVVRASSSPVYPARTWRGNLSGDILTGAASWVHPPFWLMAGRGPLILGSDLASALLLGPASPPLDMLYAHYTWRNLRGFFALSTLERMRVSSEDTRYYPTLEEGMFLHRYLSLHGLEILLPRLRVRLSEIVLFTGEYRNPEGYYLNPFHFYLAGHYNRGGLDNISWDLSFHAFLGSALLFGELYIDDAQYETPPTREPDQIAWTVGYFYPHGPWSARIQYTRVNAWTYLHEGQFQNWVYLDFPLGYALGPDVEEIRGQVGYTHPRFRTSMALWIRNKGENTLHTPWPVDRDSVTVFPPGSHFMWGVVEQRWGGTLSLRVYTAHGFLGGLLGVERVHNARHRPGVREWQITLRMEGRIAFP